MALIIAEPVAFPFSARLEPFVCPRTASSRRRRRVLQLFNLPFLGVPSCLRLGAFISSEQVLSLLRT